MIYNIDMKLYSWNVNGLRAVINKNSLQDFLDSENPDIFCLQEIKAKPEQVLIDLPEYEEIWNPATRPGYSGTAIFTKIKPIQTFTKNFLDEGRIVVAEFEKFFLVNVYTPNSKHELTRLELREKTWDPDFLKFIKELELSKSVITCGDFNAAHEPIDLARPKDNEENAGYTIEERRGITNIINAGFIDTFRYKHPDEQRFTWWTWRANARIRNIGWRIDYFFISESLKENLKSADIHENILGSDHCPISIEMEF